MRPLPIEPEADPVDHIIAWHDGDSRAAIETLMEDIQHLRLQLALATVAMGKGFTRGWKPDADRDAT
ncbi:dehydrogenase [Agrobacterium pusense]|uniref:Dehydrogenase n=1 Tax=Agrobacterium pusense TaxID=648995 RepID=A0AA44EL68_9HYPH|nr:dehydrogenase [Agrobacterium pusense]NRF08254.1 dehydrogenase [Agrobacterium pusense]NRF20841.1 dehydrogenase [Agrobacterium pusense]PZU66156.1 MAG: dehydrogenase [Rhizobium sp.]WFN87048.1 dehydrogenase [Agrobacterium pusense]